VRTVAIKRINEMTGRHIAVRLVHDMFDDRKYSVSDISPTFVQEWWLICGTILLALAWSWPWISAFRRWLRKPSVAPVAQLSCFQLDGWRTSIDSSITSESRDDMDALVAAKRAAESVGQPHRRCLSTGERQLHADRKFPSFSLS
jgi:hypothetical protein